MVSPTILVLASIDRLLISSQDVDTRLYSSKRLAYFSVSIATFICMIFNVHYLIKVNIVELFPFYFVCYFDVSISYMNFVSYSLLITNVAFCLLMIILCVFAFKNVRHIRAIRREKRNQIRPMTKKDFQLLRCLFVHCVVYIIFSAWICIFYIYDAVTKEQIQQTLRQTIKTFLNNFLTFIYNIYYSTSFFIFVIVSKAFRHELKRMIYKIIGKDLALLRDEENRHGNVEVDNREMNVVNFNIVPA